VRIVDAHRWRHPVGFDVGGDERARRRVRSPVLRWLSGLLAGTVAVAAVTGVLTLVDPHVPAERLQMLYLLVVMPVAIVWGISLAVVIACVSALAYTFVSPVHSFQITNPSSLLALVFFLATAIIVGQLAARLRQTALRSARLSEEQAALRRVATLVARSVPATEVFEAVTREIGLLCRADLARMEQFEDDGTVTGIAVWSRGPAQLAVGTRLNLDGPSIARAVRHGDSPVRVDTFTDATGAIAKEAREAGIRSSVGCPIIVTGHLWGVIAASRKDDEPFPHDTESQLASFTELIVTTIENTNSRTQLDASRARVVAAADDARRQLERDLHDGAQQQLISLALELRMAQDTVPDNLPNLRTDLDHVLDALSSALEELRQISRGLHPAILSEGGLGPGLRALARRSAIPIELHIDTASRYPPPVEVAAYYVVSEAITNTTKHADASHVEVTVEQQDATLRLHVRDDGIGGADPKRGSGLTGLRDRVEALSGAIDITSPTGDGTVIQVSLPVAQSAARSS
jgi:signal transduction histidine kinase